MRLGATVSTAAPAPGSFVEAYQAVAARGAEAVLSIHVGANTSATIQSARLAAEAVGVADDPEVARLAAAGRRWLMRAAVRVGGGGRGHGSCPRQVGLQAPWPRLRVRPPSMV
ncbi:MAG: DegV family protein [Acidimicrobiales bacterium]